MLSRTNMRSLLRLYQFQCLKEGRNFVSPRNVRRGTQCSVSTGLNNFLSSYTSASGTPKGESSSDNGSSSSYDERGAGGGGWNMVENESEEEFQMKMKILKAALSYVKERGWSSEALKAGANDLNLSEAISSLCTPFDLVEYFQRYSNLQLENHLKGLERKDKTLYTSMEYRLKLVVPYVDRYHEALGISLEPGNVPRSLKILRELSDIICVHGLGDTSTDLRWYTKRSGVISLYIATECCMIQDKSQGYKETWEFLHRRVKDYELVEKAGSSAVPFVESGIITVLNILGMNRKR